MKKQGLNQQFSSLEAKSRRTPDWFKLEAVSRPGVPGFQQLCLPPRRDFPSTSPRRSLEPGSSALRAAVSAVAKRARRPSKAWRENAGGAGAVLLGSQEENRAGFGWWAFLGKRQNWKTGCCVFFEHVFRRFGKTQIGIPFVLLFLFF